MKKIIACAAAMMMSASFATAEPLLGTWRTIKDDNGNSGEIVVKQCGDALCGTLVKSYDANGKAFQSPNVGKQIISATKPTGNGAYKGKVYSPDRGKTYNSRLQLSGKQLKVQGCVLGICRDGGTWTKTN